MTYQAEVEKIEQPLSAELYKIRVGDVFQYYTSYESDIVFGGVTYLARPMKRTGFSVEKTMKTVDVTISTPVVVAFGEYLSASPYSRTYIDITKVFVSSPDTLNKLIFSGMVFSVSVKKGVASVLCKSNNGLLSRKIPRVVYQTNCNWSLFSADCGVSKTNYEFAAAASLITANNITLPTLIAMADKRFQGGTVVFGAEQRLITNHVGTVITVLVQFPNIIAGDQVKLYPGCNGSPAACASFGNAARFMGMPHIPTRNALLWGFR